MKTTVLWIGILNLFLLPTLSRAAEKPMVRLQTESIEQIHGKIFESYQTATALFPFLGMMNQVGRPSPQGESPDETWSSIFFKKKFSSKLLPGVDLKKPLCLFSNLEASILNGDFSKCEAVAAIPCNNELEFRTLLKKYEIGCTPSENGLNNLSVPNLPVPAFLRFQKGYAWISLISSKPIETSALGELVKLIDPNQKDLLALQLNVTRIPKELKKFASDQIVSHLSEIPAPMSPPEEAVHKKLVPLAKKIQNQLLMESNEVNLKLDLDSKLLQFIVNLALDGQAKTELSKDIAAYKTPENSFGSLSKTELTYGTFLRMPLFAPEIRDLGVELLAQADQFLKADNALPEGTALTSQFLKCLQSSVKKGNLDLAYIISAPNKDNQFTALAALHLEEADTLLPLATKLIGVLPEDLKKLFKMDATKVQGLSVNSFKLKDVLNEADFDGIKGPFLTSVFGKDMDIKFAFAKDALYVAIGPDAEQKIAEAIQAKPLAMPVIDVGANGKHTIEFLKALSKNQMPAAMYGAFGNQEKFNMLSVKTKGGERLEIEVRTGLVAYFVMAFSTFRAQQFQAVPAAPVLAPPQN